MACIINYDPCARVKWLRTLCDVFLVLTALIQLFFIEIGAELPDLSTGGARSTDSRSSQPVRKSKEREISKFQDFLVFILEYTVALVSRRLPADSAGFVSSEKQLNRHREHRESIAERP